MIWLRIQIRTGFLIKKPHIVTSPNQTNKELYKDQDEGADLVFYRLQRKSPASKYCLSHPSQRPERKEGGRWKGGQLKQARRLPPFSPHGVSSGDFPPSCNSNKYSILTTERALHRPEERVSPTGLIGGRKASPISPQAKAEKTSSPQICLPGSRRVRSPQRPATPVRGRAGPGESRSSGDKSAGKPSFLPAALAASTLENGAQTPNSK